MLCKKCSSVEFKPLGTFSEKQQNAIRRTETEATHGTSVFYILHDSFDDLCASANTACHLCNVIRLSLMNLAQEPSTLTSRELPPRYPVILKAWMSPKSESLLSTWEQRDNLDLYVGCGGLRQQLSLHFDIPEPLKKLGEDLGEVLYQTRDLSCDSTTGSEASFEWIKYQLQQCQSKHTLCHRPSVALPKRVVKVGTFEEPCMPRVIEPDPSMSANYIALSHCWGDPSILHETQRWILDVPSLPPIDEWPKTFRDAVHVARKLEVPYLWIDAACIKQNDENDFAIEAAKMAEYFGNAYLVVFATHAKDSREGCFTERNPLLTRVCAIGLQDAKAFNSYVIPRKGRDYLRTTTEYEEKKAQMQLRPLDSRAWVLQESLLCCRQIQYGKSDILWSCLSYKVRESEIRGFPIEDISPQIHPLVFVRAFLNQALPFGSQASTSLDGQNTDLTIYSNFYGPRPDYQIWYDTVSEFSRRSLTFSRDTLPSMSGIAKTVQRLLKGNVTYLAGLWLEDLRRGLLWAVFSLPKMSLPPRATSLPDPEQSYPSWSWISMSGSKISYFLDSLMYKHESDSALMNSLELKHFKAEISLKSSNAVFGEICSGRLRFSARLLSGTVGNHCRSASYYAKAHPAFHGGMGGKDYGTIEMWELSMPPPCTKSDLARGIQTDAKKATHIKGQIALDRYALRHVFYSERPFGIETITVLLLWPFHFGEDRCLGLGLLPIEGEQHQYRRIGRVEVVVDHQHLRNWDAPLNEIVLV